jgi:hypothetical protein
MAPQLEGPMTSACGTFSTIEAAASVPAGAMRLPTVRTSKQVAGIRPEEQPRHDPAVGAGEQQRTRALTAREVSKGHLQRWLLPLNEVGHAANQLVHLAVR